MLCPLICCYREIVRNGLETYNFFGGTLLGVLINNNNNNNNAQIILLLLNSQYTHIPTHKIRPKNIYRNVIMGYRHLYYFTPKFRNTKKFLKV